MRKLGILAVLSLLVVALAAAAAYAVDWDSPASTDTFTLRDVSFSYSILLEVGGAHVTQR
jgi:hypothetical protein